MSIIKDLEWRHATKAYIKNKKVSKEELQKIIRAMYLAPTSSGLQPFEIIVVESDSAKEKLASTCFLNNAEYVYDSSYTIIVVGWDKYTAKRIDHIYKHMAIERNLPEDRFAEYVEKLKKKYLEKDTTEQNFSHIARQAYIAIGMGLAEAASLHIDTTPMEGFFQEKVDKLFKLNEKGLKSLCLISIGYSNIEKDWNANLKKVRHTMEEFVTTV